MSHVDKLRANIDSGRTGDKVPGPDPAAAPLGTDEEAAGTPITSEQVDIARSHEVVSGPRTTEDGGASQYLSVVALIIVLLVGATIFLLNR